VQNPKAEFYLSLITYSYDLEFQIKTKTGWMLSAKIPQEVFDIIAAKIDISIDKKRAFRYPGNNYSSDSMAIKFLFPIFASNSLQRPI
jgi:hypothetical protein